MTEGSSTADLQRRLAEAEETLRAIREGEVDALLVRGDDRDQVFHLGESAQTYRAFMEAMDLGAVALDEDKHVLYANSRLESLLRRSRDQLQSDGLFDALGTAGEAVNDLLDHTQDRRLSIQAVLGDDEDKRHVVVAAAPLPLSFSTGWALTFTDITDNVIAATAAETERIGRAIMASVNEAVVVCDQRGNITHANSAVLDILRSSPVGLRFEDAFSFSFTPGAGALLADDVIAVALGGGSLRGLEATILSDAKVKDVLVSAAPLRQGGGSIGGCIITLVDMTERKALEKRQTLLMRELDHRMKNMLALVQSISTRTIATSRDLADFKQRFFQRVAALAATQDLLSERAWTSVSIAQLLEAELAPYLSPRNPRVQLDNLALEISRDAAVALGLVFHELVTNAVKYGSLSSDSGRLSVAGLRLTDGTVEILWREEGGPTVRPPTRSGFGQTVITRGLGNSAAEPTQVAFLPTGLACRLLLAREAVVGSQS